MLLDALNLHMPRLYEGIMEFLKTVKERQLKKADNIFANLEKVSIDYGLMEKAKNVLVIPATFSWDDVGAWSALYRVLPADADGNIVMGNAVVLDASNSVVICGDTPVAALGVRDIVVVASDNGILICDASRAQEVRRITQAIAEKKSRK